ncbi:MAG TPA: hypothetical protein VJB66_01650 [Candidatus Nanoarchaeia archaeon]|nr:hypothetical protein [Candidatus Nanoarchaeia archaeon]
MAQEDLVNKYKKRLNQEFGEQPPIDISRRVLSYEYMKFKKAFIPPQLSWYEKACQISEQIIKVKPDPKRAAELEEALQITHLNATPTGTLSFALLAPIVLMLVGSALTYLATGSFPLTAFVGIGSLILIIPFQKIPDFLANNWRLKASNQMVQCIFYIVTYMRHTSNLERAIEFTSDHVGAPLSLDLRKVLWDVETGAYETIKDSLENYLKTWEKWNREFIESFHLIESSLYEPSEGRRMDALDKALTVMLTETYEKMLHYAHNLQSPVTMLHMLGVILPILGLVILPMVVSFMTNEDTSPTSMALGISAIYNVLLPVSVFYLSKVVLSNRPTGYGQSDISEENPELSKFKNVLIKVGKSELRIQPFFIAVVFFAVFFIIGVSPLILHALDNTFDFTFYEGKFSFMTYICAKGNTCDQAERFGPYGLGASILSLFVTLSIGISMGLYFKLRSQNVIGLREKTKQLEQEFASALFQLGNRLGDNIPAEIAFGQVAEAMKNTESGRFFSLVSQNIINRGMSVEAAIFDPKQGALVFFPSKVIESSMKVLLESSRKGPKIAAQALMSMSRYIKEIHRVDERLKDLLAEIIASMKGQIKFLTPAIAGIVIGITSMITTILNKLSTQISLITEGGAASSGSLANFGSLFGNGVPVFYFQVIVGIYVVQITYILTILSNGIENGADNLNERFLLGKYMLNTTVMYVLISLAVMLMFNIIAVNILPALG